MPFLATRDPVRPLLFDLLGLIRLVAFLESELGTQVQDDELLAENFTTLRSLSRLIASKTPGGSESGDGETAATK